MSILFAVGLIYIGVTEAINLHDNKNIYYTVSDTMIDSSALDKLHKFDDSFNVLVGTRNESINLLDNPIISINVYELTEEWIPKISETVKLRKCTYEDKIKFMADTTTAYYPNSLCFEDKSQIRIEGNWFDATFKNIYVAIEACN